MLARFYTIITQKCWRIFLPSVITQKRWHTHLPCTITQKCWHTFLPSVIAQKCWHTPLLCAITQNISVPMTVIHTAQNTKLFYFVWNTIIQKKSASSDKVHNFCTPYRMQAVSLPLQYLSWLLCQHSPPHDQYCWQLMYSRLRSCVYSWASQAPCTYTISLTLCTVTFYSTEFSLSLWGKLPYGETHPCLMSL